MTSLKSVYAAASVSRLMPEPDGHDADRDRDGHRHRRAEDDQQDDHRRDHADHLAGVALRLDAVHDRAAELDLEGGVVEGRANVVLELLHDRVVDLRGGLVELHVEEADGAVLADATALAGVRVTDADHALDLAGRLAGGLDVLLRSLVGEAAPRR